MTNIQKYLELPLSIISFTCINICVMCMSQLTNYEITLQKPIMEIIKQLFCDLQVSNKEKKVDINYLTVTTNIMFQLQDCCSILYCIVQYYTVGFNTFVKNITIYFISSMGLLVDYVMVIEGNGISVG